MKNPAMRALQEKYLRNCRVLPMRSMPTSSEFLLCQPHFDLIWRIRKRRPTVVALRQLQGKTVVESPATILRHIWKDELDRIPGPHRYMPDVVLPILQITVPVFQDMPEVDGFALKSPIRYARSDGERSEHPENLVVHPIVTLRFVSFPPNRSERQTALLEGQTFINAEQLF